MIKEDEYVANALESLELAERAASPIYRKRLLTLGERWLDLADRIHHRRPDSRRLPEHPLVKSDVQPRAAGTLTPADSNPRGRDQIGRAADAERQSRLFYATIFCGSELSSRAP